MPEHRDDTLVSALKGMAGTVQGASSPAPAAAIRDRGERARRRRTATILGIALLTFGGLTGAAGLLSGSSNGDVPATVPSPEPNSRSSGSSPSRPPGTAPGGEVTTTRPEQRTALGQAGRSALPVRGGGRPPLPFHQGQHQAPQVRLRGGLREALAPRPCGRRLAAAGPGPCPHRLTVAVGRHEAADGGRNAGLPLCQGHQAGRGQGEGVGGTWFASLPKESVPGLEDALEKYMRGAASKGSASGSTSAGQ